MHKGIRAFGLALLGLLLLAAPAQAHKLKVFAAAEGETVTGFAYFFGGGRAIGARVIVTAPDGRRVADQQTDPEGNFRFEVTQTEDLRITVESPDGHVAFAAIAASELIIPMPVLAAPAAAAEPSPAEPGTAPAGEEPAALPPDIAVLIETAVARQVRPLREQLDAWSERVFWRDVLGGLGIIIGFAGLAYGLTARRGEKR